MTFVSVRVGLTGVWTVSAGTFKLSEAALLLVADVPMKSCVFTHELLAFRAWSSLFVHETSMS